MVAGNIPDYQSKSEKEESGEGEWMVRNSKGRAKTIMDVNKDKDWECVDAVMDSGTLETVCGPKKILRS